MRKCFNLFLISIFIFVSTTLLFLQSCGQSYKDIANEDGRRYILDHANQLLTTGHCQLAKEKLDPLYNSIYVNNEIKLMYASVYACFAAFNFAMLIGSIISSSGNIWAGLVNANYSASSADGKVGNLLDSARIIRSTATTAGSFQAVTRPVDANAYMIFIQLQIITTTISTTLIGRANPTTGAKGQAITGLGTDADRCRVQVAVSTIADCVANSPSGSATAKITTQLNSICGGSCVTNLDPAVCTAAEIAQGVAYFVALDSLWQ